MSPPDPLPERPASAREPRSTEFQADVKLAHERAQGAVKENPKNEPEVVETDVLIVGSGPIGAVFARKLVDEGISVLIIDMGEQGTRRIGDHKKNSVAVQKDISRFTNIVKGELQPLSVPTNHALPNLEPQSWGATSDPTDRSDTVDRPNEADKPLKTGFLQNGQNPDQQVWNNLPAAAATRVVGGMGSHWTCCTPEQHPDIERSPIFKPAEWRKLYSDARALFLTNSDSFENSARQQLVKRVLRNVYGTKREIESMPLACQRSKNNQDYVEWTSSATILGDLSEPDYRGKLFRFRPNTQLLNLARDQVASGVAPGRVRLAVARDLLHDKDLYIVAEKYVVCAGAVLTPGILYKSGIWREELPALGKYMTEQTMSFCQVVLKKSLVENADDHLEADRKRDLKEGRSHEAERKSRLAEWIKESNKDNPRDPIPFPYNDPDPQVYFPLSEKYPWHTQIHRDAFGYGEVPANIDQRLVVDFRWFGYTEVAEANRVDFSKDIMDAFGMPQPTFHFKQSDDDAERCQRMITDMVQVSRHLGGFLPGAEPKYLAPGSALHICGTYRAGKKKKEDNSVVSPEGKVWGIENLFLGGCGVIPTKNACNPTLTAACFALHAARKIAEELGKEAKATTAPQ